MNTDRKSILRFLASCEDDKTVSLALIASGCAIGYEDAEREMLSLDTLGLVSFRFRGWMLTHDGRDFVQSRMAA